MVEEEKKTEDREEQKQPAPAKSRSPWLALIAAVILSPLVSVCITQFVIIPKIKGAAADHQAAVAADAAKKNGTGKDGKPEDKATYSYEFQSIVVNLAGTMGTRYLKVTFTIFSSNPDLQKIMTDNKSQLLDIALNVLSSRSLADLELAGAKNLVRNDLTTNFNQALNGNVVSQIYFSEFVVQ